MRLPERRLSFQLVSLFDLLMIVIFAQYLDVRERSQHAVDDVRRELEQSRLDNARLQREADRALVEAGLGADLERLRDEVHTLQAERDRQAEEQAAERDRVRQELQRLSALAAQMFQIPESTISRVLANRSPDEVARMRAELKRLAQEHAGAAIRQVLAISELEKRLDVWQLHIDDDGKTQLTAGGRTFRILASSAAQFEAEVFKAYKTLPQPKSLVVLMVSWGDADFGTRSAALAALQPLSEKLRADTDRHSRFEYAVLGFIPGSPAPSSGSTP